ncbi:TupA-like ATPgrasp [Bacillus sp. OK838]|nr:TupA-like ATPgrasp [Bacillus sp. OK838]
MNKTLKKIILTPMNLLYKLFPKTELDLMFFLKHGYKLNLNNPKTYNEKLNWMKLYYRNDFMPLCADKYTVRQYVKDRGCEELLNELLWSGFDANEIPFDDLPQKFVIKVTHGSGNNIICTDKNKLNKVKTVNKLNKWLKQKYLPCYGEWFYGKVKPRIIIENFLSDDNFEIPLDYKLFCFNNIEGNHRVGFTVIDTDRFKHHKRKIFDTEWNELSNLRITFPYDEEKKIQKPKQYERMIDYAIKLSKPFPHARIDFYVVNNKIYFGEITFMNDAGYGKISPYSFHKKMGDWIKISEK